MTRRSLLPIGTLCALGAVFPALPALAEMTEPERRAAIGEADTSPATLAQRGSFNEKALFKEDFWYKLGKKPKPVLGIDIPGGLPFVPVQQRYLGYRKFSTRLSDGLASMTQLKSLIESEDWASVNAALQRPAKGARVGTEREQGFAGTALTNLPLVMGLFANPMVQSENSGTANANLLLRYFANEVDFCLVDMSATMSTKPDKAALLSSWNKGVEFVNAYLDFINQAISPKVGDKFVLIGETEVRQVARKTASEVPALDGFEF